MAHSTMAPPRAIFFDLDDTLADGSGLPEAIRRTCDELSAVTGVDAPKLHRANGEAWREYWPRVEADWTLGNLSGDELSTEVWRRTLVACGADASLAAAARAIHVRLALDAVRLFDDAADLLAHLHGRMPLVVITNGASDTQRGTLRALGIEDRFAAVIISGEVGTAKPAPSVFGLALRAVGVEAQDAWHVGDHLENDVAGALGAGISAIWLNRRRVPRADDDPAPAHEIASLAELPRLLADA